MEPAAIALAEVERADLPGGIAWLSPGERERLSGMTIAARRESFLLGRLAARRALAALAGDGHVLPSLTILAAPDGAPEARSGDAALPVTLSLSHSEGRAVCAAVPGRIALGVDVERIAPRGDGLATDFFTAEEQALVRAAPAERRPLLVNLIWSAKESALKALRDGLRRDTRDIAVDLGAPELRRAGPSSSWTPLAARSSCGLHFAGWLRHDDRFVTTVLSRPGCAAPCDRGDLPHVSRLG